MWKRVVGTNDPNATCCGSHPHIGFVVGPEDFFRPLTAVAPAIDGQKDDPGTGLRQLLTQMRIVHGRALRIGPHVIADEATHTNALDFKRLERSRRVFVDFALWRVRETSAKQRLAVKPQELSGTIVEA